MNTRSILRLIILWVIFALWASPEALAKEDTHLLPLISNDHKHYLDVQELKIASSENPPVYHVWIKTEYTPAEQKQLVHDRHTSCLPTAGYDCLSYSLEHYLFNPAKMEIRSIEILHYGQSDNMLDHIITPTFALKWRALSPGSEEELLFKQISDYISAQAERKP